MKMNLPKTHEEENALLRRRQNNAAAMDCDLLTYLPLLKENVNKTLYWLINLSIPEYRRFSDNLQPYGGFWRIG